MTLNEIRRRPTLPGRFQPSTISVLRLNFCVRDGNRWIPQAIVTGNMGLSRSLLALLPSTLSRFSSVPPPHSLRSRFAPASASLPLRLPFPRTLKTAQVRFRFPPSDQDFAPLLALTFLASLSALASSLAYSKSSFFGLRFRSQVSSALSMLLIPIPYSLIPYFQDQALDRLVSPSSIHYCTSTDDLSTLSSSRGLTRF